jgi:hypothetical protein
VLGYGPENQNLFLQSLGMSEPSWRKMLLTMLIVSAVLIAIVSYLLMLRYLPPAKDPAAILYKKFTKAAGVKPVCGETPLAYSYRVAHEKAAIAGDTEDITGQYLDARYGPPELMALDKLEAAVSRFARGKYTARQQAAPAVR